MNSAAFLYNIAEQKLILWMSDNLHGLWDSVELVWEYPVNEGVDVLDYILYLFHIVLFVLELVLELSVFLL